jgi:hypothetical protein
VTSTSTISNVTCGAPRVKKIFLIEFKFLIFKLFFIELKLAKPRRFVVLPIRASQAPLHSSLSAHCPLASLRRVLFSRLTPRSLLSRHSSATQYGIRSAAYAREEDWRRRVWDRTAGWDGW